MADRIITAEAIITAKDGTGDVFAKIGRSWRVLVKTRAPARRLHN